MTVLYPTHNRLFYNQLSLPLVIQAAKGRKVIVIDDMSTDGTWEWLQQYPLPDNVELIQKELGNSTAQWAFGLQDDLVADFCNDALIHRDSLDYIESQLARLPKVMGISPWRGEWPELGTEHFEDRTFNGCGVYRTSMFEKYGPIESSNRFFGFTAYQERISADLGYACFYRDTGHCFVELDFSVWSRVKEYTSKGYGRNLRGS